MGSVDIVLPSRETYPDSQNLRSDGAKIRRIIESPNLGLFLLHDDFSCKVLLYFQFYLYLCNCIAVYAGLIILILLTLKPKIIYK